MDQNFQPPGSALWPLAAVAVPPGPTRCRRPRWSEAPRWPRCCQRRPRSCGSGGCPWGGQKGWKIHGRIAGRFFLV